MRWNKKIRFGAATSKVKDFATGKVIPKGEPVMWIQFTPSSRYPFTRASLRALADELGQVCYRFVGTLGFCRVCGNSMVSSRTGATHHLDQASNIDDGQDSNHVAIPRPTEEPTSEREQD